LLRSRRRLQSAGAGRGADAGEQVVDELIGEGRGEWLVGDEQAVVAGAPELVDECLAVGVRAELACGLGLVQPVDRESAAWAAVAFAPRGEQLVVGLGGAEEFAYDATGVRLRHEPHEATQLFAEVGFDVAGVGEREQRLSEGEVALEGECPLRGPPLVDGHATGARTFGDLLDGETGHAVLQQQFAGGDDDLLPYLLRGPATTAAAHGCVGHVTPKIYEHGVYIGPFRCTHCT